MNLSELADKYGTDKRADWHDYCRIYETYMAEFRDSPISLLEIGVKKGKSLRMWREYFPQGQIHGVEIREYDDPLVFHGSACDPDLVAQMPAFDFIVDDGSHKGQEQIDAFDLLWQHLNPGGVYAIEDLVYAYRIGDNTIFHKLWGLVHTCNWHGKGPFANCRQRRKSLTAMEKEVEFVHFYTHIVFIKKRKSDRV